MTTIRSVPTPTTIAPLATEAPVAKTATSPAKAPAGIVPDLPDAPQATNAQGKLPKVHAAESGEEPSGLLQQMVQQFGESALASVVGAGLESATCERFAKSLGSELGKIGKVSAGEIDAALMTARKNATAEALSSSDRAQLRASITSVGPVDVAELSPKQLFNNALEAAQADYFISNEEFAQLKEQFDALSPEDQQAVLDGSPSLEQFAFNWNMSMKPLRDALNALSNMMKKSSDTSQDMLDNLK